ncbi:hypothetical protein E3T26_02985 [Cryobacterium sp. TMT1-21]|uniref:Uncharacterized protein n=1 Tax=Cryobacterium shii TaxID=1259235 RepID=A0AAQ2HGP6_9MICO|nr:MULTISPECIES: hypothetical protein [Cryobacterium]TFC51239.1 hypothetical protein E3O49_03965 [Cryobacterium shii]TFC85250.1 hypothetical protein E3T24_08975 [Cryobacterium sp. TmT2-59]TFD15802.1 hypothetical protein E3T42_09870 [Cryobacterium sp. TMT4-10]TFD17066.1 hypothetical protein E3T26_02985 [Cryobacterium sp. TMT1-21]TFD18190.1 hypothetical protein E3T32_12690 [Cryobacterium sp. TMT2-23]
MSGSAERVVFLHDRPGQEALLTGGTISRLRSDGAEVVVLFGASGAAAGGDDAAVGSAMAELDVSDWRMLPAASVASPEAGPDRQALAAAVADVLDEIQATALVIGTEDERLRDAAVGAADTLHVPVFASRSVSGAIGQRIVAIDVSDHVEQKLRAVWAYPGRWSVTGHTVLPVGAGTGPNTGTGSGTGAVPVVIGGTETYLRLESPHRAAAEVAAEPGLVSRALAGVFALLIGAAFGVVGTIAHQATVPIGPVTIPVGLILALTGVTALLVGLRLVLGDRMIVLFCALGLLGSIFLLSLRSTGGSVLVPQGLPGMLWTVVPALVATLVLAWPRIPARPGSQ